MNVLKFFKNWREQTRSDPTKHCVVHDVVGCVHVDGILCDMKTCSVSVNLVLTPKSVEEIKRQGLYENSSKA